MPSSEVEAPAASTGATVPPTRPPLRDRLLVGLLVCAAVAQAIGSLRGKSLTFDELTYIPAGYSYVVTGDYRLNPEHPPLAKLLGGLALVPLAPAIDTAAASWRTADQWAFGRDFFGAVGADTPHLVTVARLPAVALLGLVVVVAFLMGSTLYGREAGLLAAWLCAFSPTLLAHGRLVTTDLPQACFVLLTAYAFLLLTRRPGLGRVLLSGCALGLALLTKFSAILLLGLVPLWVAMAVLRGRLTKRVGGSVEDRRLVAAAAVAIVLALFVVTLAYRAPGRIDIYVRNLGVLYTNVHLDLPAYLAGSFHRGRVWYYFVAAFLLKTPTAFLVLLGLRTFDQVARRGGDPDGAGFLLLPAAVWLAAMSATALPFGIRYVLPIYPLLFVWAAGILAPPRTESPEGWAGGGAVPAMRAAVVAMALCFAAGSLWAYPHYIPYFNRIAGGPDRGIEWLDDSNVDWGQDLPLLRDWLVEHDIDDAVLVPMGLYDPGLYGVPGTVAAPEAILPLLMRPEPPPGVYAVGQHLLTRARWNGPPAIDPLTDLEAAAVLGHSIRVFDFRTR